MSDYDVPTDPAAEVALLGAILRAGELPADIEASVYPDDFADPHRGAVYAAILQLVNAGKPCDYVSVIGVLDVATRRAMNNGLQLLEFSEMAPLGASRHHAEQVASYAERRRYLTAALQVIQAAREGTENLGDLARAAIDGVPRGGKHRQRTAYDVLQEIIDPQALPAGTLLGMPDLDDYINPLLPGSITAIGARSGVGKTTFALDILRRGAYVYGKRTLLISIEMTDREVFTKVLSAEAHVDHTKVMRAEQLNPLEERKVNEAVVRIGDGTLFVADVDGLTLADVRALYREYKPDLAAIDFLGMVTLPKADRHDLALSEFVYGVKRISAEEGCHTMILSQFNRAADGRTDKRPNMGDFKDSAALEHASHLALLLHRPDLYDEEERPGEVDVFVGKQRNGMAGRAIALAATLSYSQFSAMSHRTPPPNWQPEAMDYTQPVAHQGDA